MPPHDPPGTSANPGNLLKPGMYAQVELPVGVKNAVVTVPASAVIDSGTRRIVLVQTGEGLSSRAKSKPARAAMTTSKSSAA